MPSLNDIRQMVIGSGPEDWYRPQVGPYFTDAYDVDEDVFRFHTELLVCRNDVDLTVQHGMKWGHTSQQVSKVDDLWDDVVFPDPSAKVFLADVFWRGALVDRVEMVGVDGYRAVLPVGDREAIHADGEPLTLDRNVKVQWRYVASSYEVALAHVISDGRDFERYLTAVGFSITA